MFANCLFIWYSYAMSSENNKKLLLWYVLKILEQFSDESHPITQAEIAEKIQKQFGMESERKAISRNIDALIDCGFQIEKQTGKGVYLVRGLQDARLDFLMDDIFSSPFYTADEARKLMAQLTRPLSTHQKNRYRFTVNSGKLPRTNNPDIFEHIDIINTAIAQSRQISFLYCCFDTKKQLVPRKDKPTVVNPFFFLANRGKYYLVANPANFSDLSNYRVDLMQQVKMLKKERTAACPVEKTDYAALHPYLFFGGCVTCKMRLECSSAVTDLIDWFGK